MKQLTKEKAVELVRQGVFRDGKLTEAGQELMEGHWWLVRHLARETKKKWRMPKWPNIEDLEDAGTEELIDAIKNLKPNSTNPTSYIWDCIAGRLEDWMETETAKRLEYRHWQIPGEKMTVKDEAMIADTMAGEGVKKTPQPFVGLVGHTDDKACNRGRTDTSDAMRAFPNRTEATNELADREEAAAAHLESQLATILDRSNLVAVNAEYSADMPPLPNGQKYDVGEYGHVYNAASTSVDPSAELQLCRYYIQVAFDTRDVPAMILLMKQEMSMALLRVQVGKSSGALLSVEAAQATTHAIIAALSDTLREFAPDYEAAIDDCRDRVMLCFQPQETQ